MAPRKRPNTHSDDLKWWMDKLVRMDDRTFIMPKWAPHIIDQLLGAEGGCVEARSIKELGIKLGVPLKYVPRAVASVARLGIVTAELQPPDIVVTIHRGRFSRRKIAVERKRQRLSEADREAIKAKDGYRCACCGETFKSTELVLDHLIPFSLRGADEPSNLVAMSRQHNMRKWDRFIRDDVKFYRGERIRQRIGVRFVEGAFWPVVNGKLRYRQPAA